MAKKASSKKTGKTKKELLDAAIAEAVGAGKELHLESVDFSDPNRPKTCLEVDFPIISVNHIASLEATSGAAKKPIYQMSKWWARRQSSVFRAMLIAAAAKCPKDAGDAAKLVWDSYYGNHQKNEAFQNLKVADIFMGGGTTIVEGVRLGLKMLGNDLNPVAWLVVKNELADVHLHDVPRLLADIESAVKPLLMPFYACHCPRGHKGKWTQCSTGNVMDKTFDPLVLKPEERMNYEYRGPEVIYTFWAKHGSCQATGCNHRTPIMSSPIIALKTLTVKAWPEITCGSCGTIFDVEEHEVRLAPEATFIVSAAESAFTHRNTDGSYSCPNCRHESSRSLGKPVTKKVDLTVLVNPKWLNGSPGSDPKTVPYGGSAGDDSDATINWNHAREHGLSLVEFRGDLSAESTLELDGISYPMGKAGGTVPRDRHFACRSETCGLTQLVLSSTEKTGHTRPASIYAEQLYCPQCDADGIPGGGKQFTVNGSSSRYNAAVREWAYRKDADLKDFWPRDEIPFGSRTHVKDPLPKHGYTHWWKMFNDRQLLVHCELLKAIVTEETASLDAKLLALGAFQQFLRCNNMFTIWHQANNQISAFLSTSNFNPKNNVVETSVFNPIGDGSWNSAIGGIADTAEWKSDPWELVPKAVLKTVAPQLAESISGKSAKAYPADVVLGGKADLTCGSSTDLTFISDQSLDAVITDPPFESLIQYAELSDFFHVWLRIPLQEVLPAFGPSEAPKHLEAVSNETRNGPDADAFYQRLLTTCWKEARRILKDGGILAFTFHHSEDGPWVMVLESLFDAGFYLEATFPIRSDETKGEGEFGSQQIEYDIVHVCRKRVEESQEVSWARLRRQILADVKQLQDILEHHHEAGLQEADLQVIRRGKALEYYSKHYGKVYVEKGREFTVKEALTGINQLLDDQRDSAAEVPPVDAEPYTRQFLRLFADAARLPRDQIQKYLRGTGVSPAEFEERGWCSEEKKVFHLTSPLEQAQKWKGVSRQGMGRDFDQAMFLIGACYENSGIRVQDTLNSEKFIPHPATGDIIDWFTRHGGDSQMKDAAKLAKQLYTKWVASNQPKVKAAQRTFDFAYEEA